MAMRSKSSIFMRGRTPATSCYHPSNRARVRDDGGNCTIGFLPPRFWPLASASWLLTLGYWLLAFGGEPPQLPHKPVIAEPPASLARRAAESKDPYRLGRLRRAFARCPLARDGTSFLRYGSRRRLERLVETPSVDRRHSRPHRTQIRRQLAPMMNAMQTADEARRSPAASLPPGLE